MGISKGYTKYTDDRDPLVVEMIADTDTEAKKHWHEVSRLDANQVPKNYLFEDKNYDEFIAIMARHDAEVKAWLSGEDVLNPASEEGDGE